MGSSNCATNPNQVRELRIKYKPTPIATPNRTSSGRFANIPPVISPIDTANIATNMNQPLGMTNNLSSLANNRAGDIPCYGTPTLRSDMVPL